MRRLEFPIKSFLKESLEWEDRIKKLKEEQEALLGLPSVDNSTGIRSSEPSNMTASIALRRLKIQSEIEEILLDKEMLRYAIKQLSEDERELLNGFFYPKKPKGLFVWEYGRKHGLGKNLVYEEKDRVLEKMRVCIEEEYYED